MLHHDSRRHLFHNLVSPVVRAGRKVSHILPSAAHSPLPACRFTTLEHYLFHCKGDYLLALGVGSLFNHSARPCLDFRIHREQLVINYIAARNIEVCYSSLPMQTSLKHHITCSADSEGQM